MTQNYITIVPEWAPDCYATSRGWVSAVNGELLVSTKFITPDLIGKRFVRGGYVGPAPDVAEIVPVEEVPVEEVPVEEVKGGLFKKKKSKSSNSDESR